MNLKSLKISKDLFEENGRLKVITPEEWKTDYVELNDLADYTPLQQRKKTFLSETANSSYEEQYLHSFFLPPKLKSQGDDRGGKEFQSCGRGLEKYSMTHLPNFSSKLTTSI